MLKKSDIFFLSATFISFLFATYLFFTAKDMMELGRAIFVGLWVPSNLIFGVYLRSILRDVKPEENIKHSPVRQRVEA